jgi:hypothetical protein
MFSHLLQFSFSLKASKSALEIIAFSFYLSSYSFVFYYFDEK